MQRDVVNISISAIKFLSYSKFILAKANRTISTTQHHGVTDITIPTAAKAGGNYLSSLLVGSEARRHGYQEGIALDVNGYISEGAGENLFEVKDGVLFTPPFTSSALPGITRDAIIKLAKDLGIEVREQVLSRESLYLADEVFMSGTAAEITPVRSVDGIQVGAGRRGPVTKRIQEAFFGLFTGETEDKWGWLDPVSK